MPALLLVAAAMAGIAAPVLGVQFVFDDEDEQEPRGGLIAEFRDAQGNVARRIDSQVSFDWQDETADARLVAGAFRGQWTGQLFARPSGSFRLHAYVDGRVEVEIAGHRVLEGTAEGPQWISGPEVHLAAGYHDLEIAYRRTGERGRLAMFWSGPGFQREPIPPVHLLHSEPSDEIERLERGRLLVDALRCTACHQIPASPESLAAPALQHVASNLDADWLIEWLADHGRGDAQEAIDPEKRRMPAFDFSRDQAEAIAAYLIATSTPPESSEGEGAAAELDDDGRQPDAQRGEHLLVSRGCLACHRLGDLGQDGLYSGGDLSDVGDKRPAEFFIRWLTDPDQDNADHRMPYFDLSASEIADLASYLQSRRRAGGGDEGSREEREAADGAADTGVRAGPSPLAPTRQQIEAGRQLVAAAGCAACHALPEQENGRRRPQRKRLAAPATWEQPCTASSARDGRRPGYRLGADDAAAVRDYLASVIESEAAIDAPLRGHDLITRSNCLACHPRGLEPGNSEASLAIAQRYAETVEHVAALIPPSLNAVGDKLHDDALQRAIAGRQPRLRPWLNVQMPRFPLSDGEVQRVAAELIAADRVPPSDGEPNGEPPREPLSAEVAHAVGSRLVTSGGFGCTSCHAVGDVVPAEAPLSSKGPNLRQLGGRIRQSWFDRWVADPLRIVPRVEMPAIATAVPGVLDEDLERQIDAVWHVLNLPDYQPPQPNPVRVVRRHGERPLEERAVVITDVLRVEEDELIKPFLVGLPNRHSVLLDLAEARVAGWWLGDVARQRTEGKVWFWESAGRNLWPDSPEQAEWTLVRDEASGEVAAGERELAPQRQGQFLTEADRWQHAEGGITLAHRLHFELPEAQSGSAAATVRLEQTITPRWSEAGQGTSGWNRSIRVADVPEGWQIRLRAVPSAAELVPRSTPRELTLAGASELRVRIPERESGSAATFDSLGRVTLPVAKSETAAWQSILDLQYTTALPVDRFPAGEVEAEPSSPVTLDVVPGFQATRLPLPQDVMPTAFGWHADGTLYLCDLKGPVWRAIDSSADGVPDRVYLFSDELAAPFGVAAGEGYVDVINKYALLRLWDDNGDGVADRTETAASGWGHTADYHDWAVGLPERPGGGYYVTLACQQDQRSPAAAHLRGTLVELTPREPTAARPHAFDVQPLTRGHRFPIGIALNRDQEIFVTDNQGNYKPFNELNHIRPGLHYGFINSLERHPDFNPVRTPPAIDIPHPWTRSVNGICFLDTPSDAGDAKFGPFEGHLVGCEYDTRRLIRMSLQRVGDTFQGAAYPFSYDEPPAGPALLGPIACAVSPGGDLYIGNIRESGWGAGSNVGTVVRMQMEPESLPAGIAEVRATSRGFEVVFTRPVSSAKAREPSSYQISSYTRESTPRYGGEDRQRRSERIVRLDYSAQQQTATIELGELRKDFVYEFQLENLTDDDSLFFPSEAHYTLRAVPSDPPDN